MNLLTVAWKSVRQRGLASSLTAFSVALGVMLMIAVLVIYGMLNRVFTQQSTGYDLIIGPKGSDLQLVLSSVYYVQPPIENLPYRFYRDEVLKSGYVETAIPIALGDKTEIGLFPIVGTIPDFFSLDATPGRPYRVRKPGRFIEDDFDAVIGQRVAEQNGWGIGTKLKLQHGGAEGHVHDEEFTVTGVLAPTGTASDRAVFIHLEGFYQIQGHDKPLGEAIKREREFFGEPPLSDAELAAMVKKIEKSQHHHHDHGHGGHDHGHHHHAVLDLQKEVTSILVNAKTPIAAVMYGGEMKKGFKAMAVNPVQPMQRLFNDILGNVKAVLLLLTGLIIVVSGVGIFVSIYNSMSDRRREIGIMRALGAQRRTVFSIILLESLLLCVGGGLLGFLLGHGLVLIAAPIVEAQTGLVLDPFAVDPMELVLLPALLGMAVLVGFVPGLTAYRTDVADALQN